MRFSENWLRESVNPDLSTEELCHQLTMAGLEVDAVEPVAPEHTGVVIGEILTAEKHPDADKLQVCQVNVGELSAEPLQIVCGAPNARPGIKVACAMIKAVLPGNFKIKKSKLRGVESQGMLCSAKELGLSDDSDGIMELAENAQLGMTLVDYYQLNDNCIELGITPNRSDCLSLEGIARETAVITNSSLKQWQLPEIKQILNDQMDIDLQAPEYCPVYASRIIQGINTEAKTPLWMVEKLRRSDIRSISLMVDITNYVLLEIGQPMHAFDRDEIKGKIIIRLASSGEKITLLDNQEMILSDENLIIADEHGPLALAGIMGGLRGSVTDKTKNIVLESAYFTPELIAGKARQLGLHTDSSHRFERGVSPALQQRAIERATDLIMSFAGGDCGPCVKKESQQHMPVQMKDDFAISFKPDSVKNLLGVDIEDNVVEAMFSALEMNITKNGSNWLVKPPAFRFDIQFEVDLIEEVARLYGYDNLPVSQLYAPIHMQARPEEVIDEHDLSLCLVSRDYQEVINYSFVDPKLQQKIQPDEVLAGAERIDLNNPISEDLSQMRTSLWQGLIKSLLHNQNRQQLRIRLFETGVCFIREPSSKDKGDIKQKNKIAGICCGSVFAEQWGEDKRAVDFFDVKSDVEALLNLGAKSGQFNFVAEKHPSLHPGQSARIYLKDALSEERAIGWIGTLHPELAKQLKVKQSTYLFELSVDDILGAELPKFTPLSKYPEIRRDIAIVVDKSCVSDDLIKTITDSGSNCVIDVLLFDTYTSEAIADDKKSLAIGITLQDATKTLVDEEVDKIIDDILKVLESKHGATLRD
ncbi:MAG: phenylalanine--tRNA ligase subunit beta [Gammaproteobacteria bacterium]|nr:phenylalanine--tRNA ligase subunit beta [Gammaproteobacteria bacterium]